MIKSAFDIGRDRLRNEITILNELWNQYTFLFHDAARVQMLNACARWFFGTVQRCMMREVILGISRLTDPPASGKFANLVIASLLDDEALERNERVRDQLEAAIAYVQASAEGIRRHRHKYVAHLDHATAIALTEELVPRIKVGEIGKVIDGIAGVYKLHASKMRDTDVSFALQPMGSAEAIVAIIERSERWQHWQEWNADRQARE